MNRELQKKNSLSLITWYYVDVFRFIKTVISSSWLEQCQAEIYLQIPNHLLTQPFTHSPVSHIFYLSDAQPFFWSPELKNLPFYHPLVSSRSAKLPRTTQRLTEMVSKQSVIKPTYCKTLKFMLGSQCPSVGRFILRCPHEMKRSCIWKELFLIELHIQRTKFSDLSK